MKGPVSKKRPTGKMLASKWPACLWQAGRGKQASAGLRAAKLRSELGLWVGRVKYILAIVNSSAKNYKQSVRLKKDGQ